ncbi:MAG: hypothetical protein H7Y43_17670, partial [Akkermansiaceae bacterium]|nr:hypothetical protein [Verrucomicrobiales bacterium]
MKIKSLLILPILAATCVFFSGLGCRTQSASAPPCCAEMESEASGASDSVAPVAASDIPDRPEKLSFPPLTYEPPSPLQYRTALKTGPVAYVVPDRELPLVTVAVYV